MEIRSSGFDAHACKTVNASQRFTPSAFAYPLNVPEGFIERAETEVREGGDVKYVETEVHMSLKEYHYMLEEAQKEGRKEAWDLARRIAAFGEDAYTDVELCRAFHECNETIIFNLPPDEVIEKDRAYQKKKEELHVGDEVKFRSTGMTCGYVVDTKMSEFVKVLTKDRTTHILRISDLTKTGNFNEDLVDALAAFDN